MGVWKSDHTVITAKGMQLLSDLAGKKPLVICRAAAGSDYTTPSELENLTDITHQQMNMKISDFAKDDKGTAYLDIYLDNAEVTTEFYHQQIGLYAKDTSNEEVLFLVAQAESPDYIPIADTPVYITHRIFLKFSGNSKTEVKVDFSGVVTQDVLQSALEKKENAFSKNSAFNKNFSDTDSDYMPCGKSAYAGGSDSVARADHVHPIGGKLKFAENNWNTGGLTNLLPDTNTWIMSNGKAPDVWGSYSFEATFTGAWEAFSCFFDSDLIAKVKGKIVELGVEKLVGASARLEMVVDGSALNYILQTDSAAKVQVSIPASATSVTLRIIIFSADDLHCEFNGVYLNDPQEEVSKSDEGDTIYLEVRKVTQSKIPKKGVSGSVYITEKGNLYFARDDGMLIPLAGSKAIS